MVFAGSASDHRSSGSSGRATLVIAWHLGQGNSRCVTLGVNATCVVSATFKLKTFKF